MTATAEQTAEQTAARVGDIVLYHSQDGTVSPAMVTSTMETTSAVSLIVFRSGARVAVYARHAVPELGSPECEAAMEAAASLDGPEGDAEDAGSTTGKHFPVRYWQHRSS